MILAIFDLQATPMLPTKFQVNWPFGSGEEMKKRFSRWPPFLIRTILAIFDLVCLFVLRFNGPVNPMGSCRARSVYLTTRLLGRLSPLSGLPVLCTFFRQKLTTALLESAEGRE